MAGASLVRFVLENWIPRSAGGRQGMAGTRTVHTDHPMREESHRIGDGSRHASAALPQEPEDADSPRSQVVSLRDPDGAFFNVTPHLGVNHARYGMLRREVRKAVGHAARSVRRNTCGPADDVYGDRQAFFLYDEHDRLRAIEFSTTAEVAISHYRLSGLSFAQVTEQVLEWDPAALVDQDTIRSVRLGLSVKRKPGASEYASILAYPDEGR